MIKSSGILYYSLSGRYLFLLRDNHKYQNMWCFPGGKLNNGESEFEAAILLQRPVGIEKGMNVLLMRTDLPPTAMRIVGSGNVIEIPSDIRLHKRRVRKGRVQRIREEDVLVEGLASSKERAERLSGLPILSIQGVKGRINNPFGTRGVVSASFEESVEDLEEVLYEQLIEEEYKFGH